MEEPQRARSHTVTTTASSFAENFSTSSSSFAYDREFLRTLPGLLIVAEIVSAGRAGGREALVDPGVVPPQIRFQGTLLAPSRLLPRVQNSETASPSEVRSPGALFGKRVLTLTQGVYSGRDPTRWALSVVLASLGSGMLGGR